MVYVIMGVSGCGKTTIGSMLASRMNIPFIDADNYHPEKNIELMLKGIALMDEDRIPWLETLRDVIDRSIIDGEHLVLACSALKQSYRELLTGKNAGAVTFIYLRTLFTTAESRIHTRKGHFMPATLLTSQYADLEEPQDALVVDSEPSPDQVVRTIEILIRSESIKKGD